MNMDSVKAAVEAAISTNDFKGELAKVGFDRFQSLEIKKGIKSGIDVYIYADIDYNSAQMKSIRLGLEEGLDSKF